MKLVRDRESGRGVLGHFTFTEENKKQIKKNKTTEKFY